MKRPQILIVEDENIVALDMRMRLEAMGYGVLDVVDSAELATERAKSLDPDLVLMDIKLKGEQDGIDAASALRESTEVPVIFVTAFTDERTLERAKRASPYGYIVKPFHERELRIAIELAIYKHQYELSLRRAKDIAEEANRVKGEFLANMSHELKTPLNSVIGFTELAMASARDEQQRDYLSMALSSAKSLLTLIDSILDFARMEAGKLAAIAAPFSLDGLLDECVDSLAMAVRAKGLEIAFRRDPAIPDSLIGDRTLLRHILLNLLDNAAKFTDKGKISLGVDMYEGPSAPGSGLVLLFEVKDSGIGMPKDKIASAFARFIQLDPSKTRRAGGTGLGLAIVAKSVDLMEGGMSVESEEGQGTTFKLRLPFDLGPEELLPRKAASMGSAALVGFGEEAFSNAALQLSRLGLEARRAGSLADAEGARFVIVDEASFPELARAQEAGGEELPASRLIVGTRLGGSLRGRLAGLGIACAPLPLRLSGLRAAITAALAAASPEPKGSGRRERRDAAAPHGKAGAAPLGSEDAAPPSLAVLAAALERAAAAENWALAEQEALAAKERLALSEDKKEGRLAFAALLAARKGDAEAIAELIGRMRSGS